jgi:hypothetical protein
MIILSLSPSSCHYSPWMFPTVLDRSRGNGEEGEGRLGAKVGGLFKQNGFKEREKPKIKLLKIE